MVLHGFPNEFKDFVSLFCHGLRLLKFKEVFLYTEHLFLDNLIFHFQGSIGQKKSPFYISYVYNFIQIKAWL